MPWNRATRKDYKRDGRRYESDVTDKEWAIAESMLPKQGRLGRPRQTDLREVFNAIQHVLATGCQWRALPRDFPPHSTVMKYFYRWQGSSVVVRVFRRSGAVFAAGVPVASTQKAVEDLHLESLVHVEWTAPEVAHRLQHQFSPP